MFTPIREAYYRPPVASGIRLAKETMERILLAGELLALHEARASVRGQGISRREGCVCCTANWVRKEPACALHAYLQH